MNNIQLTPKVNSYELNKLSIIMPVYNEKETINKILERVKETNFKKEIIVVDDFSTDGTREILMAQTDNNIKVFYHSKNMGKGAAIKTGLQYVTGEIVIIQDADLEYDPDDYPILIKPIIKNKASVVYGSRFTGEHKNMFFWHYVGNRFLTLVTNVLYDTTLSDMETCYKAFKTEVIKGIKLRSNRFDFEPEITAKVLKLGHRIYEVPISYSGREKDEGKKITWRDGITALYCLIKYRFMD